MAKRCAELWRVLQARQVISNTFVLAAGNKLRLACKWCYERWYRRLVTVELATWSESFLLRFPGFRLTGEHVQVNIKSGANWMFSRPDVAHCSDFL